MKIDSIRGAGGGGSNSPTRTDDNLFARDMVEIVLALGEGPIRGLKDGMKSFYVGGTPLMSEDGSINFDSFNLGLKKGTPDDTPINYILGGESSNTAVGTRLYSQTWIVRQTDDSLKNQIDQLQVRLVFNTLYTSNDDGTFNDTAMFHIQYRPSSSGGVWSEVNGGMMQLTGKTTSGYPQDFIWDVPRINDNWDIRVMKENPDSSTTDFCDISWESFQMVTKGNRTYNRVALLHLIAKATSQFSSIPQFGADVMGLEISVPSNYNPDTRTYDTMNGPWDGLFKQAWTNNPAWILYDLLMNANYGFRKYFPWITCNRFDFYDAAQWCDTFVPDGKGGLQPRYTFNMVIKDQQLGLDMLQYVAGSFGAVVIDDATGMIHLRVDKWEEPKLLFTPENVTPDGFSYTFTDMSTRYNDIEVQFVNPDLDWNQDVRPARDDAHIALNGHIPLSFPAIGCTDEHEALRRAFYRLITATTETATVSFTTTRLGCIVDPFRPIYIADPVSGYSTGGRIKSIANGVIYLRDPIYFSIVENYNLKLQAVSDIYTLVVAPGAVGPVYELAIVSGAVPADLPDKTVFTIEDTGGFGIAKPFRAISCEPVDNQPDQWKISAVEINMYKQLGADNCEPIGSVQYSFKNPMIPPPARNMQLASGTSQLMISQDGSIIARILASWDAPNALIDHYLIHWKESNQPTWLETTSTGESVLLSPCRSGVAYDIVVWAVGTLGGRSSQLATWGYVCLGKDDPPSNVTNFTATRRAQDVLLKWDPIPDLDRAGYEVRLGDTWDTATVLVTDYAATQLAWTTDTGGTYSFLIRAIDSSGNYSQLATLRSIVLRAPSSVSGAIVVPSGNRLEFRWNPNPEDNILDYELREGSSWTTALFVAKIKSTSYSVTAGAAGTRTFWLKAIASPGIYSDNATFITTDVAQSDNTNVLYTSDEVANGFTGSKYNMVLYGTNVLRMDDGKSNSEYIFSVDLPDVFKAQNSLFVGIDAIVDDKTTWAESTFAWNDLIANKQWVTQGDINSINYTIELSTLAQLPSNVLYQWRMNNSLDVMGSGSDGSASEQQTISYAASKYGSGLYVQVAPLQPVPTQVTFSTNIPNDYSSTFWVNHDTLDSVVYATFKGRNGAQIQIGYDNSRQVIYAIDETGLEVWLPAMINLSERYLIGFVQDVSERRLYLGRENGTMDRATIDATDIGAVINVSLY